MKDIILIGGGGHCRSVLDSIVTKDEFNVKGIIDIKENVGLNVGGYRIIGTDNDLAKFKKSGIVYAFVTLGSVGISKKREQMYHYCKKLGFIIPNIIDKTAILANDITVDSGVYIGKGTIINANTTIGNNSIINNGSIIEHDCIIGKNVHVSPGVTIGGTVQVGDNTHLGIGSTVIQNIKIGNDVFIGSSSNVVKNITSFTKVYGNPAKEY